MASPNKIHCNRFHLQLNIKTQHVILKIRCANIKIQRKNNWRTMENFVNIYDTTKYDTINSKKNSIFNINIIIIEQYEDILSFEQFEQK